MDDELYSDLVEESNGDYTSKLETQLQDLIQKLRELDAALTNIEKEKQHLATALTSCEKEKHQLAKFNQILQKNISSLFKTARSEIERKDKMIKEIRTEYDNMAFRRKQFSTKEERSDNSRYRTEDNPRDKYYNHRHRYNDHNNRHTNIHLKRQITRSHIERSSISPPKENSPILEKFDTKPRIRKAEMISPSDLSNPNIERSDKYRDKILDNPRDKHFNQKSRHIDHNNRHTNVYQKRQIVRSRTEKLSISPPKEDSPILENIDTKPRIRKAEMISPSELSNPNIDKRSDNPREKVLDNPCDRHFNKKSRHIGHNNRHINIYQKRQIMRSRTEKSSFSPLKADSPMLEKFDTKPRIRNAEMISPSELPKPNLDERSDNPRETNLDNPCVNHPNHKSCNIGYNNRHMNVHQDRQVIKSHTERTSISPPKENVPILEKVDIKPRIRKEEMISPSELPNPNLVARSDNPREKNLDKPRDNHSNHKSRSIDYNNHNTDVHQRPQAIRSHTERTSISPPKEDAPVLEKVDTKPRIRKVKMISLSELPNPNMDKRPDNRRDKILDNPRDKPSNHKSRCSHQKRQVMKKTERSSISPPKEDALILEKCGIKPRNRKVEVISPSKLPNPHINTPLENVRDKILDNHDDKNSNDKSSYIDHDNCHMNVHQKRQVMRSHAEKPSISPKENSLKLEKVDTKLRKRKIEVISPSELAKPVVLWKVPKLKEMLRKEKEESNLLEFNIDNLPYDTPRKIINGEIKGFPLKYPNLLTPLADTPDHIKEKIKAISENHPVVPMLNEFRVLDKPSEEISKEENLPSDHITVPTLSTNCSITPVKSNCTENVENETVSQSDVRCTVTVSDVIHGTFSRKGKKRPKFIKIVSR